MNEVTLRPDMRTPGGEICDIVFRGRFVGTLTLVYRESDKMAGALQLEQEVLSDEDKDIVCDHVHRYVQALVDAMRLKECEVMVTFSSFDHVIASDGAAFVEDEDDEAFEFVDEDLDYETDWVDHETRFDDDEQDDWNVYTLTKLDLAVTSETRDTVEYRIYEGSQWIADAFLRIDGTEATGTVDWSVQPTEEEIDEAAELLAGDLENRELKSLVIDMMLDDVLIQSVEIGPEDFASDEDEDVEDLRFGASEEYNIVLVRDDGDILTYEIYQPSHSALPIGMATIDISEQQITGFIDFREPGDSDDREQIAMLLMQELEKERDYDLINLTMMHRNCLIEEMLFETETVH